MISKEDRLSLFKWAITDMGNTSVFIRVVDNVVVNLASTNGKVILHSVGFCKTPWNKW